MTYIAEHREGFQKKIFTSAPFMSRPLAIAPWQIWVPGEMCVVHTNTTQNCQSSRNEDLQNSATKTFPWSLTTSRVMTRNKAQTPKLTAREAPRTTPAFIPQTSTTAKGSFSRNTHIARKEGIAVHGAVSTMRKNTLL